MDRVRQARRWIEASALPWTLVLWLLCCAPESRQPSTVTVRSPGQTWVRTTDPAGDLVSLASDGSIPARPHVDLLAVELRLQFGTLLVELESAAAVADPAAGAPAYHLLVDADRDPKTGWRPPASPGRADFGADVGVQLVNEAGQWRGFYVVSGAGHLLLLPVGRFSYWGVDGRSVVLSIPLNRLPAARAMRIVILALDTDVADRVPDEGFLELQVP